MKRAIVAAMIVAAVSALAIGTLTSNLLVTVAIQNTKAVGLTTVKDNISADWSVKLTDGTGANQADTLWHDQRTLADGANETIDVHDGSLSDAFGTAVTLDKLKMICIKNGSSDADLEIGGAAATQLGLFADGTDILNLPPGGIFVYSAPGSAGLDCSTNSDLKLTHDGTGESTLTYDIIVVGID